MRSTLRSASFASAYALDLVAGDPHSLPHPVRVMGIAITLGERCLRRPGSAVQEMLWGALLAGLIVAGSWSGAKVAARLCGTAGEILLAWTALATKSLLDESRVVVESVEDDDILLARRRLARIVGRDTDMLQEPEILRAVIETIAEGLCDGVVAPMVYLALGGVPLAFAYKAVNTLDSMIGHREPPYLYFGRFSARLDDVANFVPARLTALAIVAAASLTNDDPRNAWMIFRRDGNRHPSPNAGQSEAAMAGALGVRLGGMNYYGGQAAPKPLLGAEGRAPTRADARRALRIASIASLGAFSMLWVFLRWREKRA